MLESLSKRLNLSDALAKQTGYVAEHPAFSHFLYFFSDCSSSSSVSVAFLLLYKMECCLTSINVAPKIHSLIRVQCKTLGTPCQKPVDSGKLKLK